MIMQYYTQIVMLLKSVYNALSSLSASFNQSNTLTKYVLSLFCCAIRLKSEEVTMECFNSLLLKLREVHEREVEGECKTGNQKP